MKAMSLRLDAELAEQLDTVAAVDGLPVSDVIRQAVAAHVEQRRKDRTFQAALREYIARTERLLR